MTPVRAMVALLALALVAAAAAAKNAHAAPVQPTVNLPGYNCPPSCDKSSHCYCATFNTPGGLDPSTVPQFVVLTNDDAVTVVTGPTVMDITDSHRNPNGCVLPATWFVSINYTDYHLVQEAYIKNHEIATHTLYHVADPDLFQIVGAKLWLNQTAYVPLEKIRGFRAPFLIHTPEQRTILQQNGFTYDSSIPEPYPSPSSPDELHRLWPYTMDYGLPQDCTRGTGPCSVNETHAGLWEFPMWDVQDEDGTVLTNMDPQGDLFTAYKREFDRNYNSGQRTPVGIYIHAAWLIEPSRAAAMNQFIEYALGQPDVWFVTMSEVLDWIKNPVSAKEYKKMRLEQGCAPPTDMYFPSGKYCPPVSCVNGNWSDYACTCTCIGEFNKQQPGFCLDSTTGACTVVKTWDPINAEFTCPGSDTRLPPNMEAPGVADTVNPAIANCGHDLQNFVGLGMSGTQDNSALYTSALQAVDGLCGSCAKADAAGGNYFFLTLPDPMDVTNVQVIVGHDTNVFMFVGMDVTNNGMNNPVCAMNINLTANEPLNVACVGTGNIVTVATTGTLDMCDIYVQGYASTATIASPPPPYLVPEAQATSTGSELQASLVNELLGNSTSG